MATSIKKEIDILKAILKEAKGFEEYFQIATEIQILQAMAEKAGIEV